MSACTCLVAYDASLPHYLTCDLAPADTVNDTLRELAEMASYRDVDAALMAYHMLRSR